MNERVLRAAWSRAASANTWRHRQRSLGPRALGGSHALASEFGIKGAELVNGEHQAGLLCCGHRIHVPHVVHLHTQIRMGNQQWKRPNGSSLETSAHPSPLQRTCYVCTWSRNSMNAFLCCWLSAMVPTCTRRMRCRGAHGAERAGDHGFKALCALKRQLTGGLKKAEGESSCGSDGS